jgi:hypothetical protein
MAAPAPLVAPIALGTYNSVTLGVSTPVQLTLPTTGHYVLYLLNTASGKLYISKLNTAGANATSFMVPTGLSSPPLPVSGPVWIASDTAGTVSVCCVPAR